MKRYKTVLCRAVCFLLGMAVLLGIVSYLFYPKNNDLETDIDHMTANGILAEPENSIDILVVGDSLSYASVSPMRMWEDYGFTAYVCGSASQPIYDSFYFIKMALEHQTPSAVVLECNTIFRDVTVRAYLASKVKHFIPVFQFHNRWKTNDLNDYFGPAEYTWVNHYKGYRHKTGINPGTNPDYMVYSEDVATISYANILVLENIVTLCKEKNIPLCLFNAPCMKFWTYPKHNAVEAFADAHHLSYLDLNLHTEELGIDWNMDTMDAGDHMNRTGAIKVSDYLGNYLQKTYILPDRRSDSDYQQWNEALELVRNDSNPEISSRNK